MRLRRCVTESGGVNLKSSSDSQTSSIYRIHKNRRTQGNNKRRVWLFFGVVESFDDIAISTIYTFGVFGIPNKNHFNQDKQQLKWRIV